ncbi:MAG: VWA domain-containing protein [Balneola sp.]|nr:MAG: VWA domain-containing protein [Balneola sp.]
MKHSLLLLVLVLFSACSGPYYTTSSYHQNSTHQAGEVYDQIVENEFRTVSEHPLSTFSIDVDGASYANVRRILRAGYLPPRDAVRIEELINYFNYSYPEPAEGAPVSLSSEIAPAPWNPRHHLIQIGIQGEHIKTDKLPPNNLVFLIDVSGSMRDEDKLPLLKQGLKLLVNELEEDDFISIVVYSGRSGVVLNPTPGNEKDKILKKINKLRASGFTAGSKGIKEAYKLAKKHFNEDANNRVIMATDGDFNVGISSDEDLVALIESERDHGIFLSMLGFGTGNLKDSKMEKIANHGNGNYYYIDNLLEAKKVLISEMEGTLHTIAKDVKIQIEFNPQNVHAYRLVGYENRLLADDEFNDDKRDAGELGVGQTVTALYEVIPVGVESPGVLPVDPLKYQPKESISSTHSDEIMTVKIRYKEPDGDVSELVTGILKRDEIKETLSENLSFAASLASFGMLLRDSKFKGASSFELVDELARNGKGVDPNGYRAEFIKLAELAELLWQGNSKN